MKNHRLSALFGLLLLPGAASAGTKLGETLLGVTGDGIMGVESMHDMRGGRWVVMVAPGYVTGKVGTAISESDTFSMKGYSAAFAVKREFTPNWGAGLVGGFTMQSGKASLSGPSGLAPRGAFPELAAGSNGHPGGEITNMYGNAVAALVTFDPFSNSGGFRLPISAGPLMMWEGFEYRHEFVNASAGNAAQVDTAKVSRSDFGGLLNVSFDFLLFKDWRLMPGISVGAATGSNYATFDYVVTRNGALFGRFPQETAMQPMFTTVYATVQYRPWDVSFNYIILSHANKLKNYSFTLAKKWGGA